MSDASDDTARRTVTGAFMLGGVALAIGALLLFGGTRFLGPTLRAGIVFQDSVSGLTVGAPVNFRGVRLGAVVGITVAFDPKTQTAFIPVTVELAPDRVRLTSEKDGDGVDLPRMIARGLRAELNVQSFVTGQSEINLEFDEASAVILHPEITPLPEIPTRQSTIQKVKEQLSQLPLRELADNANATLRSLRGVSEKLDVSLPPLLDSLRASSDRSTEVIAQAGQALTTMSGRLDGVMVDFGRFANAGTQLINQRGAELHTVLATSNQVMTQARDVLADLKGLTAERGPDRVNIDSALRDLATAAAALRGLANDIERNPKLLLTGRQP